MTTDPSGELALQTEPAVLAAPQVLCRHVDQMARQAQRFADHAQTGQLAGVHVSVHDAFVDWSYMAMAGAYGLVYVAALLVLAIAIFSQRDFV